MDWVTGTNGSWPAFSARVQAAFEELAGALESGQTAVVSTSGGPIAAVGVALLGLAPEGFVALNRVAVNAGVTKIVTGSAGRRSSRSTSTPISSGAAARC